MTIAFLSNEGIMKKLMKTILAVLLILSVFGCKKNEPKPDDGKTNEKIQQEFHELTRSWFIEDLSQDYLSTHFALYDPVKLGIKDLKVNLGEVETDKDEEIAKYKDRIEKLKQFDETKLTHKQALTLKNALFNYELNLAYYSLEEDYDFCFAPSSGDNSNLSTNLMEFDFRNEQDVKDFITLLNDVGRFFDEEIEMTRKQAERGIIQSEQTFIDTIEQCENFISKKEDNELIVVARNRLEEMNLANKDQYMQEIEKAVLEVVIPAYQRVIDFLLDLSEKTTASGSLHDEKHGKEYYEVLVKAKTGCSESVDELLEMLDEGMSDCIMELIASGMYEPTEDYGFNDCYKVLEHIKEKMKNDFPELPKVDYTVEFLDPSMAVDSVLAYYLLAPADNINVNVIKARPMESASKEEWNELCLTLAHEGYPGHLYQHTYFLANFPDSELDYTLDNIGYIEGWAKYCELMSYPYFVTNSREIRALRAEMRMSYYLYGYIDMQIHYNGWTVEEVAEYMNDHYFNGAAAQFLYDALVEEPAMYLPYSVGMCKMWNLYNKAVDELGKKFVLKDYHKVILDCGDVPFDLLSAEVDNYIKNAK